LCAQPLLPLTQLGRELLSEVVGLEHRTDLHHAMLARRIGDPPHPLDRLLHRPNLPHPVAGKELLGLCERAIDHLALGARELDAHALRTRMKTLPGEHHPGLDELLVEGRHLLEQLLARHFSRLALLRRLDQHHDSHPPCLLSVGLLLPLRRASEAKIDTNPKPAVAAATRWAH